KQRTCGSPAAGGTVHDGTGRSSALLLAKHGAIRSHVVEPMHRRRVRRRGRVRRGRSAAMLRDLGEPEREAYFRGVQPIWGGGLNPDRFVAFQQRLADSPEAGHRYRLLGLFDGGRLLSAMKAYELHG